MSFPSDSSATLYMKTAVMHVMKDATIDESQHDILIRLEMPSTNPKVHVSQLGNGILISTKDGEEIHCFIPLPKNANVDEMVTLMEKGHLQLRIPKGSFT